MLATVSRVCRNNWKWDLEDGRETQLVIRGGSGGYENDQEHKRQRRRRPFDSDLCSRIRRLTNSEQHKAPRDDRQDKGTEGERRIIH